jgi:hypothetical protein
MASANGFGNAVKAATAWPRLRRMIGAITLVVKACGSNAAHSSNI